MVKFVLLRQFVPKTFDGGFRCNGYEVQELVDIDGDLNFKPGELEQRLRMKIPERQPIPEKQHQRK